VSLPAAASCSLTYTVADTLENSGNVTISSSEECSSSRRLSDTASSWYLSPPPSDAALDPPDRTLTTGNLASTHTMSTSTVQVTFLIKVYAPLLGQSTSNTTGLVTVVKLKLNAAVADGSLVAKAKLKASSLGSSGLTNMNTVGYFDVIYSNATYFG